ncbi:hypothetical protein [Methylomonas sp. ZR1]|uniref:hypothetical protein n=1 Tax=Methylomonas sp. ZR1 TaxID=1797072 RepID=UPI0014918B8D|nr:hypothetical protein [Methylomonas sp. ZR1]
MKITILVIIVIAVIVSAIVLPLFWLLPVLSLLRLLTWRVDPVILIAEGRA